MSYEIIWESGGVIKRFFGHVDDVELMQAVVETEGSPRFDELRYVINDFLEVTGVSAGTGHVDEIAAIDQAASISNRNIRIAVVATHPEILALADHYARSPMNVYPTRIFSTMAEGRAWLGASEPHGVSA